MQKFARILLKDRQKLEYRVGCNISDDKGVTFILTLYIISNFLRLDCGSHGRNVQGNTLGEEGGVMSVSTTNDGDAPNNF